MTTLRQFLDDNEWEICQETFNEEEGIYEMTPIDENDIPDADIDFRRAFIKIREAVGD